MGYLTNPRRDSSPRNYVLARLGHDGKAWPSGLRGEHGELGDDGWVEVGKRRKRRVKWYLDVALANYSPVIVWRAKLDDIRKLEALRWRCLQHVDGHLTRLYERAVARLRAVKEPRCVIADRVHKITFVENHHGFGPAKYPHHEPIAEPKDPTLVDRLSAIPTPTEPNFKAGENWIFYQSGVHSGYYRVGRVEAALEMALRLYIYRNYPKIVLKRNELRPQFIFIINGRIYPIPPDEKRADKRWQRPEDIVVNLDEMARVS